MTVRGVCASERDRAVAESARREGDALAQLPPAARNPAPDTPVSPEARRARQELARLARLRRRVSALFDLGPPSVSPWGEDELAVALDWLRRLDRDDPRQVRAAAEELSDPLRELAEGTAPISEDDVVMLIDAADPDRGLDLHDVLEAAGVDVGPALTRIARAELGSRSIDSDAGVEVLMPLRIETRFRASGGDSSIRRLCLRVYPDEISIARPPTPATAEELDALDEALGASHRGVDDAAAFSALASRLGAARAAWLLRTTPISQPSPTDDPVADRRNVAAERDEESVPLTHKPAGLPGTLDVWIVPDAGEPELAARLELDLEEIARDLEFERFAESDQQGEQPATWWTSFARAVEVGLGIEIERSADDPELSAIVVCGRGDSSPDELIGAHADSGRLAILPPGTPTNTVEGERTTELGRDPSAWRPLAARTGLDETATLEVMLALTGRSTEVAPLLGGDTDVRGPANALVEALWPVLWGRALRDAIGADVGGAEELDRGAIDAWAHRHLQPEGPYAAIRVGEQPYGLLPATSLARWREHEADPVVEQRLRSWVLRWRDEAAAFAEASGTSLGADSKRLLALLGESAPSRRWGARPVAALPLAQALQALYGHPLAAATPWELATAESLAGPESLVAPVAPVGPLLALPGPEVDTADVRHVLDRLVGTDAAPARAPMDSRDLIAFAEPLGLLGHLLRASLINARAVVGQALRPVDSSPRGRRMSLLDHDTFVDYVSRGTNAAVSELEAANDETSVAVAERFRAVVRAAREVVTRWERDRDRVFGALLAVLDTAAFRVDPWATGIADRRLRALTGRAPFRLGAYGWVDGPRPHEADDSARLPPGPTAAGLLHAPSPNQALTAALLRDAAVRHPDDDRWALTIDSARVRTAARLAERVRLGVHPYEALGLEVERLVGDWERVRWLRSRFPLHGSGESRPCDGRRVLAALVHGEEPVANVPPGLAKLIAPLAEALDTYGDLLIADGVHALVSGRGDLANAAMEAAAGLGAPPELRAIRTPRAAATVSVSVLAALPPGAPPGEDAGPAVVADPAFAALLDAELGPPAQWRWTIDGDEVTLDDLGLHGAELLEMSAEELTVLLGGRRERTAVESRTGTQLLEQARRLAALLGGGEEHLPAAVAGGGLADRLEDLLTRARALERELERGLMDPSELLAELARWRIAPGTEDHDGGLPAQLPIGLAELRERIAAASTVSTIDELRPAIRALAGQRALPVLPLGPLPEHAVRAAQLDREWLEIVAAVRPRLAQLEARQLSHESPWPGAVANADGSADPWTPKGPVTIVYGPGLDARTSRVAIAALDGWVDSVPSREHATSAAFGFNGPKARAPQAVLLAVPPDLGHRMTSDELCAAVLETRSLLRARAARPGENWKRVATPASLIPNEVARQSTSDKASPLLRNWPDQS